MVRPVAARPPANGALDCTCTRQRKEILERKGGVIGAVGPESVITLSMSVKMNSRIAEAWDMGAYGSNPCCINIQAPTGGETLQSQEMTLRKKATLTDHIEDIAGDSESDSLSLSIL